MSGSGLLMAYLGDWRRVTLEPDEMLTTAEMFLRDAEALHGSRAELRYFLILDAIELALSSFLDRKGVRRPAGHDIAKLLAEARSHGLTTSHTLTDNLVFRLKKAAEKADAGWEFSFERLQSPADAIALAWSLLRDTAPQSSAWRKASGEQVLYDPFMLAGSDRRWSHGKQYSPATQSPSGFAPYAGAPS